jgi:signal transduction histidine kinase
LFRQPTVWEEHRAYVIAGVTAVVLQSLLIVGLLVNRRKRRRAERALADQVQFETVLSDVSSRFVGVTSDTVSAEIERALACIVERLGLDRAALFQLSEDGRELLANITSVRAGEAQPPAVVPLDSIPWMWAQLTRGDVFHVSSTSDLPAEAFHERELADHLGVKSVAAVALQDDEQVVGMLTFGLRTHEQAWDERILQRIRLVSEVIGNALAHIRADEALAASRNETRQLTGRILTAQEDERKRIARELHDDISQRLAAGAIEAGKAERELTAPQPVRAALAGLKDHLIALSDDVHRLSRQLHPAILDDLGLKDALRAECDRVAERGRLAVNFRCGQLPADVPRDLALCVYRIAQEALRNAVKHARADRVDLLLNADLEFLNLEVRDFGSGFDPAAARKEAGLGLASMEERVRLVGGEISISSRSGQGTCIQVRVPLPDHLEDDP